MTTTTYTINATDTETTPAWQALCSTVTPGAQDSGRVRYAVTTEQPEALETALDGDDDVLEYATDGAAYTITTDSSTETITAASADDAARAYAAGEGWRGIETAEQLRAYVERAGGHGTMQDDDGVIWTVAH